MCAPNLLTLNSVTSDSRPANQQLGLHARLEQRLVAVPYAFVAIGRRGSQIDQPHHLSYSKKPATMPLGPALPKFVLAWTDLSSKFRLDAPRLQHVPRP